MSAQSVSRMLTHWKNFKMLLVFQGILVGLVSGLIVVFYRFVLEKMGRLSVWIYHCLSDNYRLIPVWFLFLTGIAAIIYWIIRKEPMAKGSGIPQVEGVLLHQLEMNWWKVILGKFIGGSLALGAGLSLGREGPSIQLGAAAGQGISKMLKRPTIEEKFLITGGASAGLAAAFNAPLAGVIFALEEVHKNFSPRVLITAMSAAVTADILSKEFFGMKPVLNFAEISPLPLEYYGYLVLLGIILGLAGSFFNWALLRCQELWGNLPWLSGYWKIVIPLWLGGILGIFLPEVMGGGHDLIMSLTREEIILNIAIILLTMKFIFTMISYSSGAPGGIFLPMLALGALIGLIYGKTLNLGFRIEIHYVNNFIILAMAGYFTAIVRAPITGCILISEMTGSLNHLLSLAVVSFVAFIVADLTGSKPIYESLLERMLENNNKDKHRVSKETTAKILLEIAVQMGSSIDGIRIKDVQWPAGTLLVSILRGQKDIIPNGQTSIGAGDYLVVLVDESQAAYAKEALLKMASKY